MKHTELRIAMALMTGLGLVGSVASLPRPAAAMGIVKCAKHGYAGTATVDPIGDRGAKTGPHSHDFYGSTTLLSLPHPELATAAQLIGGGTTCTIKPDTAAYWQPTLYQGVGPSMARVPVRRMEAYYLCWNGSLTCPNPASGVRPLPTDLRMIAGNPMARQVSDMNTNVYWHCGLFSTKPGGTKTHYATPVAADCATAKPLPGRPSGVALTASVTFPSCWDGRMNDHTVMGNTADYSGDPGAVTNHLAYPVRAGGALSCPAAFPIRLPRLRENVQWDYAGDGHDVKLASDMTPGAPAGVTLHADFLQSWSPAAMQNMVNTCIDTTLSEAAVHQPPLSEVCGGPVPK